VPSIPMKDSVSWCICLDQIRLWIKVHGRKSRDRIHAAWRNLSRQRRTTLLLKQQIYIDSHAPWYFGLSHTNSLTKLSAYHPSGALIRYFQMQHF